MYLYHDYTDCCVSLLYKLKNDTSVLEFVIILIISKNKTNTTKINQSCESKLCTSGLSAISKNHPVVFKNRDNNIYRQEH